MDQQARNTSTPAHHRFSNVSFRGGVWDLSHLEPFAIRLDPGLGFEIDVVVLFSCHCFTKDPGPDDVPEDEWYEDGRERRVLCADRYQLSRMHLRDIVVSLDGRRIVVANETQGNFLTVELIDQDPKQARVLYAVFFAAEADRDQRKRVILRVQSAYRLGELTARQRAAKKVGFSVLVKKAYQGERVRP